MVFEKIKGHDGVLSLLGSMMQEGLGGSSLLFSGPRSVGKYTVARMVARYLLCTGTVEDGCRCEDCRLFPDIPDYFEVSRYGNMIKVDDVDRLVEFLSLKPYRAPLRVAVIDEADNIHPSAANGLLKIIEDLIGPNLIVLVTSNLDKVPPMLSSRLLPVRFGPLSTDETMEILKSKGYHSPYEEDLKRMSPYMSESILTWFSQYAGHTKDMPAFLEKFPTMDDEELVTMVDELDKSCDLVMFLDVMARCLEDIMKVRHGAYEQVYNVSRIDTFEALAAKWNDEFCLATLGRIKDAYTEYRKPLNLKLKNLSMPAFLWTRYLFDVEAKKNGPNKEASGKKSETAGRV